MSSQLGENIYNPHIQLIMPPLNMLLWHKDYFELKILKKLQIQDEPGGD